MAKGSQAAPWTRRDFIKTAGVFGGMAAAGWPAPSLGQGLKTITASHSVSTFVYGQHLVAAQKKFFEEEGLKTPDFIVPGGGAKVVQALAAGQVQFALGDSNHPLKITEKGKDALMIFATDRRCSYANVVVRKELFDKGVKSVEALADGKLVGRKAVIAATAIGSGTHVYGVYVLKSIKAADGKPVNDAVEWVGGGARSVDADLIHSARFLGASEHQIMRTVIVPSALAWTFASLTPSISFALIGVVVGEFIGGESGGGLGYLIIQSLGTLNAADMMVALFVLGAIGIVMALGIRQIEMRLLRWRPEYQKR